MGKSTYIEGLGEIEIGEIIQFPGDTDRYVVLGINEDGVVIKKINMETIVDKVINDNAELLEALKKNE